MNKKIIPAIIVIAVALVLMSAFIVDETEQAVVTRFERVKRTVTQPGLHFRLPWVERALKYPNNLQEWDGDPGQIPTKDKTYIWVDTFARWRINDPVKFFRSIGTVERAQLRLDEIIDPAVRNFVTSNHLIETVRNSNRELDTFEIGVDNDEKPAESHYTVIVGRETISRGILEQAKPKLIDFGITLVDVKIKRLNYVQEVRQSVYERMISERKRIAEKFRSEGKGEAQKIIGQKELKLKEITSEAYRTSQEIKGTADAESTRLYAEAFGIDPEFYSFTKTLEIYAQSIGKDSSLVLSTDSELMKYLKSMSPDGATAP